MLSAKKSLTALAVAAVVAILGPMIATAASAAPARILSDPCGREVGSTGGVNLGGEPAMTVKDYDC
jgi:hypothetical protein